MTRLILINKSKSSIKNNNEKLASLFIKKLDTFLSEIPNYVANFAASGEDVVPARLIRRVQSPLTTSQLATASEIYAFTRPHCHQHLDLVHDQKLYYYYLQTLNLHENIVYYNNLIFGLVVLFLLFSLLVLFEENAATVLDTDDHRNNRNNTDEDNDTAVFSWSTVTFVLLNTFIFVLIVFAHNFFKQFIFCKRSFIFSLLDFL